MKQVGYTAAAVFAIGYVLTHHPGFKKEKGLNEFTGVYKRYMNLWQRADSGSVKKWMDDMDQWMEFTVSDKKYEVLKDALTASEEWTPSVLDIPKSNIPQLNLFV
jgi:hypothetical protein